MTPRLQQYRLAIAVFGEPDSLWAAIGDLVSKGFKPDQLCLAGQASRMRGLARSPAARAEAAALLLADLEGLDIGEAGLVATSGPLLDALRGDWPGSEPGADTSGVWLASDIRARLNREMADGGVMLVASALSADQQLRGARVLLGHACGYVQTHEFSVPSGRKAAPFDSRDG